MLRQSGPAEEFISHMFSFSFSLSHYLSILPERERLFYEQDLLGKDSSNTQGALGEAVGLSLFYLSQQHYPLEIISGPAKKKEDFPNTPFSVMYKDTGTSLLFYRGRSNFCEIDTLGIFDSTTPIILESKTGRDTTKVEKRNRQIRVASLYGQEPYFVELKFHTHKYSLRWISQRTFRIRLPLEKELFAKARELSQDSLERKLF